MRYYSEKCGPHDSPSDPPTLHPTLHRKRTRAWSTGSELTGTARRASAACGPLRLKKCLLITTKRLPKLRTKGDVLTGPATRDSNLFTTLMYGKSLIKEPPTKLQNLLPQIDHPRCTGVQQILFVFIEYEIYRNDTQYRHYLNKYEPPD